jgi:hypothetical protein
MGKKKQTKKVEKVNIKHDVSTKSENVIKDLNCCITKYFPNALKDKAILAKDDKGEYI